MHKLGLILLEQQQVQADPHRPSTLTSVMSEAASLQCCLTAYNVHTLKRVLSSRMDNGEASNPNDAAFHTQLLVSSGIWG